MYIAAGQTGHWPDDIPKSHVVTYGITGSLPLHQTRGGGQNALSFYATKSLRKPGMPTHWQNEQKQHTETGKTLEVVWESLLHWLSDTSNINKDIIGSCVLCGNKQSNILDVRLCHRDRQKRIIKTQQKYMEIEKSILHTQFTTFFPSFMHLRSLKLKKRAQMV